MPKPLCLHMEMNSFVALLLDNTISSSLLVFASLCFGLPLIFNANVYILLNVVSMNHHDSTSEVDSTASTSTSGRLVDLGVWVSQKTRNHPG